MCCIQRLADGAADTAKTGSRPHRYNHPSGRAGEQGATEVRNLAGRSASAAREIKALIDVSVTKVRESARMVDESGHAVKINTAIKHATDVVAGIAAASEEQTTGIGQVNIAISQMD